MAKWGKCEFAQLKKLQQQLDQLSAVDFDAFCRDMAGEIASMLLKKVVKRTPVGERPHIAQKDENDKRALGGKDAKKTFKIQGESYMAQTTTKKGEKVFRKRKGRSYTMLTKEGAIYQRYWSGYQGGTLRRAWTILPIEKQGGSYTVTVVNPTEYASYVEYGHRQTPGRYVPALGKRLKASWVPGKFMLTISTQEVESQAPKLLEKRLYAFLKGCLDGK